MSETESKRPREKKQDDNELSLNSKKEAGDKQQNKKRRKGHFATSKIHPGGALRAFLVTTDTFMQAKVKKEFVVMMEQFMQEFYPEEAGEQEETNESSSSSTSVADEIAKEIADLQASKKADRPFQFVETDVRGVLMLKVNDKRVVPAEFLTRMFQAVQEAKEQRTRFVVRISPLQKTAMANMDGVKSLCEDLVKPYFTIDESEESIYKNARKPVKFAVVIKNRSSGLDRMTVIDEVAKCVEEADSRHTVDLGNPDVAIVVEIFRASMGIGIVPDYGKLFKLNFRTLQNSFLVEEDEEGEEEEKQE